MLSQTIAQLGMDGCTSTMPGYQTGTKTRESVPPRPGPPQFHIPPSVQHTSSTQKGHSFSAPEIPKFHTKNPSVQHNPLSSTPKTPQFHTKNPSVPHRKPLSSTHSSVSHQKPFMELRGVWN